MLHTALPCLIQCDSHRTAIPERDLRVPKSPAWSATRPKLLTMFVVQTRSLQLVALASTAQHIPRAREPAANDKSGRSRDKSFTHIVTDLYNPLRSKVSHLPRTEILPTSDASQQELQLVLTSPIPDREAPPQRASCQPPTQSCQMSDPTGSHDSRKKIPSKRCYLNGTFPCTFHRTSKTGRFRTILFTSGHLHHEVIAMNERSNVSFHVHKQTGIPETFDEVVFFQDLRVMHFLSNPT